LQAFCLEKGTFKVAPAAFLYHKTDHVMSKR